MKKILVFFILAAAITFCAVFGIKLLLNKKEEVQEGTFSIQIEVIKNVVLIEDKNLKTWSVVDNETKVRPDSILATYGNDSGILLKLKKDLLLGLGGDSSLKVTPGQKDIVNLLYGCYGLKGTDKGMPGNYYCSYPNGDFKFLDPLETNAAALIPNTVVSPCGEMFEADAKDDTYSVKLNANGLKSSLKLFQVASDKDLTKLVFESKAYWNSIKTPMLKVGKYYWRVKGNKGCSFEIVKKAGMSVLKPRNQEIVSDGTIEFEWGAGEKNSLYTLTIMSGFSGKAQAVDVRTNKYVIDDPLQTLGPGYYFWYVKDGQGRSSTPRSFYIMTGQDILLESPKKGEVVDPSKKFIPIIWEPMLNVKVYGVAIASNPSFVSMDYANTTEEPFVFVPMLKDGNYFLKISALFDNNKRISTDAIPFSVKSPGKPGSLTAN
jgi:hypothetical protein